MQRADLKVIAGNFQRVAGETRVDADGNVFARPLLGEVLRMRGAASDAAIDAALQLQATGDIRLGDALRANGAVTPVALKEALEAQWRARHIDLDKNGPDGSLINLIGSRTCLANQAVPWRRIGTQTVIATEKPEAFEAVKAQYENVFGPVMMALADDGSVARAIAHSCRTTLVRDAEARVPPDLSCRTWRAEPFRKGVTWAGFGLVGLGFVSIQALTLLVFAMAILSLLALIGLKFAAAWAQTQPKPHSAEIYDIRGDNRSGRLPVISVLVPIYKEERIATHLIARLSQLTYPKHLLNACIVVEEDDDVTRAALKTTKLPTWMSVIIVPGGTVKTKPRALNYALDFCRGSIVGIYDAEDAPAKDQLEKVANRFAEAGPKVACLQGALDFYNTSHNWMSRCFTLEYATWFRVILPGIARIGWVVPLGGTTLFFRRSVLEELGAWDAHNVTEDADLGVRLARNGYVTEILDTVTREEANSWPWSWVKQRSRWLKGYAMTYAIHMRDPIRLWRDLGPWKFLGFQTLFLGTLTQISLAPFLWSIWWVTFGFAHPLNDIMSGPLFWTMIGFFILSELVSSGLTLRALYLTDRLRLAGWIPTLVPYYAMATLAMYKAFAEMLHKPFYWDKTDHGDFGGQLTVVSDVKLEGVAAIPTSTAPDMHITPVGQPRPHQAVTASQRL